MNLIETMPFSVACGIEIDAARPEVGLDQCDRAGIFLDKAHVGGTATDRFDPDRAGFAALLARLEEITEQDDAASPQRT